MSLIPAEGGVSRLRPAWSIEEGQGSEKPCLEKQKQPTKQKTPENQNQTKQPKKKKKSNMTSTRVKAPVVRSPLL